MAKDGEHEPRACDAALTRAFELLGKRWSGVLLGTLLAGPAGFSSCVAPRSASATPCSPNVSLS